MNIEEALLFKVELDSIKESEKRLCSLGQSFLTFGMFLTIMLFIIEFLNKIDGTGTDTLLPYAIFIIFILIDAICWITADFTYGVKYRGRLNGLKVYVEEMKK